MNDRLTRKDIKRDEFADAVGKGVLYAETHSKTILYSIGGALLVAALAVGIYLFLGYRAEKANEALARALKVHDAQIDAVSPKPDDAKEPTFKDEASRAAAAKKLFEEVESRYGMSDAADVAGLYLAEMEAGAGKLAEARKTWEVFVKEHKGHMLAGQAQLNLLALDRKEGKAQEVAAKLRTMLEDAEPALPQDVALYELGVTLEQLGQKPEALLQYQRILDEYPQSPYRSEATQKISALDPTRTPGMPVGLQG